MNGRGALAFVLCLGGVAAAIASIPGVTPPTVAILASCAALPADTCFGDRLNVFHETDAGPDPGCTSCLQQPACCDAVGRCEGDPACVSAFQATQACVVAGGPSEEDRCRGSLTTDDSRVVYDCMRSHCGPTCGVPNCTLDKEVVLLEDPTCDRCLGGSCCQPINDCYGDRRCKLVIECISSHCPNTFGSSLTEFGLAPADVIEGSRAQVCAGAAPPVPLPACLRRCLDDFAPEVGADGGSAADQQSRCLAFGVYACGASARCGPPCTLPEAGAYSTDGTWPEDQPDAAL